MLIHTMLIHSHIENLTIRSTVRMAAMFDVYAAIMIKEKNHQAPPTSLPATDLGAKAVY